MIPRGTPDISWADLGAALLGSCLPGGRTLLQDRVETRWSRNHDSLACLSVRTGFDLVLQALALPAGSEILVSALTIRDMCRIIEHHGLVAVPIDIDPHTLTVDAGAIERVAGPRSRAILVAHLFGSRMPLDGLIAVARRHRLLVIEDCAQAFDGSSYHGDLRSDISMFSFGPIKTFTALGGALLRFKDRALLEAVRARQAGYPLQQRRTFLRRVLLFTVLKMLAHRLPLLMFVTFCRWRGLDHDHVLNRAVRSFAGDDLFRRLRRRPCSPLLRLLDRRLRNADPARIAWRVALAQCLMAALPAMRWPGVSAAMHAHWILPLESQAPDRLVRLLWASGFDATRHASSLAAVLPAHAHPAVIPDNMIAMLEHLLYLPIYPGMTEQESAHLARIIVAFETRQEHSVTTTLD